MHLGKRIVLSLLYYIWEKNNQNMFNTHKKPTKNHVDSCYYAMLLIKLFSVQVHSREIQINLGSVVYSRTNDALTFSLSNCFQVCNFIKKRLQHRCFPVNIAKFLKTPNLKNIWERLLMHVILSIISGCCSNVLISTSFYQ